MPDTKISALPVAGALAGTEPVPIVQAGATKQSTTQDIANLASSTPSNAYFDTLCALLEPAAIEQLQSGSFSYAVASNVTKWLIASHSNQIGGSGRVELRNPQRPIPLCGTTLAGVEAGSAAWIINPLAATYTDSWTLYYDRLAAIAALPTRQIAFTGSSQTQPFIPGAYGGFLINATAFDMTWVALKALTPGVNTENEINDGTTQRVGTGLCLPLSKNVCWEALSGTGTSGALLFVLVPSTWSQIPDTNTYIFRDDFMGSSLNTGSTWTKTESSVNNIQINTTIQCLKMVGNANWGTNGLHSQASTPRASGKICLVDVYLGRDAATSCIVGFHDGSGDSYTDFAHGLLMGPSGGIQIYENGNNRGTVGSGVSQGGLYRVRITLGTNAATYAIQGGSEYQPIGSASWSALTPGISSSSSTTPLYAGASVYDKTVYLSDFRIYTP